MCTRHCLIRVYRCMPPRSAYILLRVHFREVRSCAESHARKHRAGTQRTLVRCSPKPLSATVYLPEVDLNSNLVCLSQFEYPFGALMRCSSGVRGRREREWWLFRQKNVETASLQDYIALIVCHILLSATHSRFTMSVLLLRTYCYRIRFVRIYFNGLIGSSWLCFEFESKIYILASLAVDAFSGFYPCLCHIWPIFIDPLRS